MINILLVEDNSTDAELFTEAFTEACECPHHIQVASDGEEALRLLRAMRVKPRLVLLDLNLPKMSGLEVLQELRQDADLALSLLPIIVLTNSRSSQDVTTAYAYRCNAFVRKPMGYPNILRTVKRIGRFWLKSAVLPGTNFDAQPPSLPPPSKPPSSDDR